MLQRIIDFLLYRKFYNDHFERYLRNEVYPDLELISELVSELNEDEPIFFNDRNPLFLDFYDVRIRLLKLKKKIYKLDGKCPCHLYSKTSKYLQIEYNYLQKRICSLLYP